MPNKYDKSNVIHKATHIIKQLGSFVRGPSFLAFQYIQGTPD